MNLLEHGRISGRQFMALLVISRITPTILICTSINLVKYSSTAWVNEALGSLLAIPIIWLITNLCSKYPDQTIIQYAQTLLGRFWGKAIGFIFIMTVLLTSATVLRSLGETVTIAMMPGTPVIVFLLMAVFLAANAARNGLEVYTRIAEILAFVTLFILVTLVILNYNIMDFTELKPFYFPEGFTQLIPATSSVLSYFCEFFIIGMLVPYLRQPQQAVRYGLLAVIITGCMLVFLCLGMTAVFGATVNSLSLPSFTLARQVSLLHFFERIESLVAIVWFFAAGTKVAFTLWAAALGFAQLFELRDFRALVYPVAAIVGPLSIISYASVVELILFLNRPMIIFSFIFVPFLLVLFYSAHALHIRSVGGKAGGSR
ncbi:MAG: GerAB/ArcD/ProY family transporter [Candidatus Saccharibacteria bacterium]